MAVIKLNQMGGIHPSVLPRNLPPEGAQIARNLNPATDEFRPLKQDTLVSTTLNTSNPKTMYRFDRNADGTLNTSEATGWVGSDQVVSLVRQQLNDDTTGRIYYTNDTGTTDLGLRWIDALGTHRQALVPPPSAAPTIVSVNRGYIFTQEVKQAEVEAILQDAVRMVGESLTASWAGPATLPAGWVRRSTFVDPSDEGYFGAQRDAIRVFALNPTTNAIVDTYSSMAAQEASWIFDPALEGVVAEIPVGEPVPPSIPAWAAGHTKWWCITMRQYAEVFDINEVSLKAALLTLKMPGTQGATPLLTDAQAQILVDAIVAHGDKDGPRVRGNIDALINKVEDVRLIFDSGGREFLRQMVAAFRQQTRVSSRLTQAKAEYAEAIWNHLRTIALATATPYYFD
jgi:hypothetical protein